MVNRLRSSYLLALGAAFTLLVLSGTAFAADGTLTILATSDSHSCLKPFGPYDATTQQNQYGGFLRVAERIIEKKVQFMSNGHNVLVLDGGDQVAGTFFHYVYKGVADMGLTGALYDATTIGNHEFDWTPTAMAGALQSLLAAGGVPPAIVASNITSWGDSPLQYFNGTYIVPTLIKEMNGMKIGIFGLMTSGTAALGQPAPITFSDLSTPAGIQAALGVAGALQAQGCDAIVLLSHSGFGYDYSLASYAAAYGVKIDVILSGHDHIANPAYLKIGNSYIIQVGAYNKWLGRLSLVIQSRTVTGADFDLESIDSANTNINGTPTPNPDPTGWATLVGKFNLFDSTSTMAYYIAQAYPSGWSETTSTNGVTWGDFSGGSEQEAMGVTYVWQNYSILEKDTQIQTTLFHSQMPYGNPNATWFQIPATTYVDVTKQEFAESNLGDLVSDGMFLRGALVDLGDPSLQVKGLPGTPGDDVTDFAVEANGSLRFPLDKDANGLTLSDIYQVLPLGIGLKSFDLVNGAPPYDSQGNPMYAPGYDLMRFHMTGADLKKAMEFAAAAINLGQDDFWLNWSGLTFEYDLSQPVLQRVKNAMVAGHPISDTAFYKGVTSTYVGSSFLVLGGLLQPAVNAGLLTQDQADAFASMKIYIDRLGQNQITSITGSLAQTYCGKAWLTLADKIMWPWWYGGLNGFITPYSYGAIDNRMVDVTPGTYRVNVSTKSSKFFAPVVVGNLMGKKAGQPGYKAAFDLNRDGIIDLKDLRISTTPVR